MHSFQRVVVALSRSGSDAELIRYAAVVTRLGITQAVHFVHVTVSSNLTVADLAAQHDDLQRLVEAHFGATQDELQVSCHVLEGSRTDALLEFAGEQEADLILLGHRKQSRGCRSLACGLAMTAPCSVWVIPEGAPATISRIIAPVDFSEHSADSLSQALMIAHLQGFEECRALHVSFDPLAFTHEEREEGFRIYERHNFNEFLKPVNTHGIAVVPEFDDSPNVAGTILRSAEKMSADLIVMSTRGRSRAAAILLGSTTLQTLMDSPLPVLAVKHYGAHLNLLQVLRDAELWQRPGLKSN